LIDSVVAIKQMVQWCSVPVALHFGGWGLDTVLQRLQAAGTRLAFIAQKRSDGTFLDTAAPGGWDIVWTMANHLNNESLDKGKEFEHRVDASTSRPLVSREGYASWSDGSPILGRPTQEERDQQHEIDVAQWQIERADALRGRGRFGLELRITRQEMELLHPIYDALNASGKKKVAVGVLDPIREQMNQGRGTAADPRAPFKTNAEMVNCYKKTLSNNERSNARVRAWEMTIAGEDQQSDDHDMATESPPAAAASSWTASINRRGFKCSECEQVISLDVKHECDGMTVGTGAIEQSPLRQWCEQVAHRLMASRL
jgi:hypothetical protein